jgi:DNA-binding transcriptional MerR regulator|tara:strand:- start:391 stop:774 length:384 start_codon:yes stop_codon:yes gene_type:complete
MNKLINISDLSKILRLVDDKNKPRNHILRYWEKEFSQIRPKIINKRRYYSVEQVEIIKKINFLLKTEGITINGVKNILNKKINKLDDYNSHSLKAMYYKKSFKEKSKTLLNKIKKLKLYGKKNTFKS